MSTGYITRGTKKSRKPIEGIGIDFRDMQGVLQYVTPRRLAIIDILYKCGPTSADGVASLLNIKPISEAANDLKALIHCGLIGKQTGGTYVAVWEGIFISVSQSMRYLPQDNILNLSDCFLKNSARKYAWLKVEVKTKTTFRGLPRYSCTILPDVTGQ